jgi:hypothetical protein
MTRLSISFVVAVCTLAACATPAIIRRGMTRADINARLTDALTRYNYTCGPAQDPDQVFCAHPDNLDFSFAYLPQSNTLQIYAGFERSTDDGLTETWRGDCAAVHAKVNEVNATYLPKLTCEGDFLYFTFYTWLPEGGLTEDDIEALFALLDSAVGDGISASGMLKRDNPAPAVTPAADAAAAAGT